MVCRRTEPHQRGLSLQLSARLQEVESQTAERTSELEAQLMQAAKETEMLKVSAARGVMFNERTQPGERCAIHTGISYNEVDGAAALTIASSSMWNEER